MKAGRRTAGTIRKGYRVGGRPVLPGLGLGQDSGPLPRAQMVGVTGEVKPLSVTVGGRRRNFKQIH